VVTVIPKPDRKDYSHPKNYRPISLFETLGKLLGEVMAKRMQQTLPDTAGLVPTNQFGGRNVSLAHRVGLNCGILLFDIKGVFDNVTTTD